MSLIKINTPTPKNLCSHKSESVSQYEYTLSILQNSWCLDSNYDNQKVIN